MRKRLSKYLPSFDYFDKLLIVLSVTTGSVSIASFATVIGASVGIASEVLVLYFQFLQELWKNCLKQRKRKRKSTVKLLC